MERKNVCQPPEYTPNEFSDFFEEAKARALRLSEIESIIDDDYDLDRLRELVEADLDMRCVVLPDVDEQSKKSMADVLEDVFQELSYEDPSVGLFGMSDGEKKIADVLMAALKGEKDGKR